MVLNLSSNIIFFLKICFGERIDKKYEVGSEQMTVFLHFYSFLEIQQKYFCHIGYIDLKKKRVLPISKSLTKCTLSVCPDLEFVKEVFIIQL